MNAMTLTLATMPAPEPPICEYKFGDPFTAADGHAKLAASRDVTVNDIPFTALGDCNTGEPTLVALTADWEAVAHALYFMHLRRYIVPDSIGPEHVRWVQVRASRLVKHRGKSYTGEPCGLWQARIAGDDDQPFTEHTTGAFRAVWIDYVES